MPFEASIMDIAEGYWRAGWPKEVAWLETQDLLRRELETTARLVTLRVEFLCCKGLLASEARLRAMDELVFRGPLSGYPTNG